MAVSHYHAGRFWKERIKYAEFLVCGSLLEDSLRRLYEGMRVLELTNYKSLL
jgi:hypothetical protein